VLNRGGGERACAIFPLQFVLNMGVKARANVPLQFLLNRGGGGACAIVHLQFVLAEYGGESSCCCPFTICAC
jgi:hypothetical protein